MYPVMFRMVLAAVASFTLTMLIGAMAAWAFTQSGHNVPVSVLLLILFPATFFLSATSLEYLEDGDFGRSLRVSLLYTCTVAVMIIGLYFVAAVVSPRPRLARSHQRPLFSIERTALRIPIGHGWRSQVALI
jgi:hypothetical protein